MGGLFRAHLDDTPPSWQADRIRRHIRTDRTLGEDKLPAAAEEAKGRPSLRKRTRRAAAEATERNG